MALLGWTIQSTQASAAANSVGVTDARACVFAVGDSTLTVQLQGRTPDVGQQGICDWIFRSAQIVRRYYEKFPVRAVTITVKTIDGHSMGGGRTVGFPAPRIEVTVGQHVAVSSLLKDWVMVHEMIHLSLPGVADDHNWFAEGVATYVEGVARVQSANMSEAQLWEEYVDSMPKGLPQTNEGGLDQTPTWARTYWGGALYCLLADVKIREQTNTRRGLQDALRAIASAGAGMSTDWSVERIFATGDAATGTHVLTDLYQQMKDQPVSPDLDALWSDLGIRRVEGLLQFDDSARLSAVRRAIVQAASVRMTTGIHPPRVRNNAMRQPVPSSRE